jgi:hypothetical protein
MLERREQLLGDLASVVDQGREEGVRKGDCPPLTAEGIIGAASSIVYARLLRGDSEPLSDLQGELMGMIVLPYLGPAAARQERARPAPAPSVAETAQGDSEPAEADGDPLRGIHMRLTYRTARVLEAVSEMPGASNRQVGEQAGIPDQGQVSKLLARLKRLGLLGNSSEGSHVKGGPYAWTLTARGARVAQSIRAYGQSQRRAA